MAFIYNKNVIKISNSKLRIANMKNNNICKKPDIKTNL